MKNKRIWLGMMLILVFAFALSSCDEVDDLLKVKVPSWAQGKWYIVDKTGVSSFDKNRPLAVEITSKELIPAKALTDIAPVFKKTEVTVVVDNVVYFDLTQVKKVAGKTNQITIGLGDYTIDLYK